MFKRFNWKRYIVHVVIAWAVFAFSLGAIIEYRAIAKEEARAMDRGNRILDALHHRIENVENELRLKEEELNNLREDNEILKRLNQQFIRENTRLRRRLMLERRARREAS